MSDRDSPPPALGVRKSPGFGLCGMRAPLSPDRFGDSRSCFSCSQQLEHGIRTDVGFSRYLPDALASGSQPPHSLEQLWKQSGFATRGCRYATAASRLSTR